jgi:hypothetical protein
MFLLLLYIVTYMRDYRRGLDWWIDNLQDLTTNNCNTLAIPTIYISLEHTH